MAEKGAKQIERNKEGVPCWDGDPTTFQEFSEVALHWVEAAPFQKRYLCGPKLQAELQGTAKRFVLSQKPGWISHDQGVSVLLAHLRRHLGQPQLTEMSDYMARYFRQSRRRKQESMNDYITRKTEIYNRACQALRRVEDRYAPKLRSNPRTSQNSRGTSQPSEEHYQSADEEEEAPPVPPTGVDSQQGSSTQPAESLTTELTHGATGIDKTGGQVGTKGGTMSHGPMVAGNKHSRTMRLKRPTAISYHPSSKAGSCCRMPGWNPKKGSW